MATPSVRWRRDWLVRGRARLTMELRDGADRWVASDPGLARLRQAVRATLAVGTTLLVEWGVATATGASVMLPMLMGAVVALLMATTIKEIRRTQVLKSAAGAPVAAIVGSTLGVVAVQQHAVGLAVFVGVSFVAVWVRRFGTRWFSFGFLFWQGYFFVMFLRPPLSVIPTLVVAIVVGSVWVAVLLLTVLYDDPQAKLVRTIAALRARARAAVSAALDVLDGPGEPRRMRTLRRQLVQLSEVALLLDGQLSDSRALPEAADPVRVRRWAIDMEIGMDELVAAVLDLADDLGAPGAVPPAVLRRSRATLRVLGWGQPDLATTAAQRLAGSGSEGVVAARSLGRAAGFLLETVRRWDSGELLAPSRAEGAADGDAEATEEEGALRAFRGEEFEPVVTLFSGNLPGTAALAEEAVAREDAPWWHPAGLKLTSRQAVQAAVAAGLAILAGELISERRFYWAVIAAFIGFTGTATAGETLRKSVARITGTVAGLVVAVWLADLTAGHSDVAVAVLLACIFAAFYVQPISYGLMIFAITLLLGQLYTLLNRFSDQILLVRLEETIAGALIGVAVALLVLPAGTRSTLRVARRRFLDDLADLLQDCARRLDGEEPERDLLAGVMVLDSSARQVVRARRALTKGRLFGADRAGLRYRVAVLGACGTAGRAVAGIVAALPAPREHAMAQVCRELVEESRRLADAADLADPPSLPAGLDDVATRIGPLLAQVTTGRAATSTWSTLALHARRLAESLALLTPRGRVS